MKLIDEDFLEQQALNWFKENGYSYIFGPELAPDGVRPERENLEQVILVKRLKSALIRLNPELDEKTLNAALLNLTNPSSFGLLNRNREVYRMIKQGIQTTVSLDNQILGIRVKVVDFENPNLNDWLVVNQLAVTGLRNNRRPDIVVYLNGLPFTVIELKNPVDDKADIWKAYNQLQTYKNDIPNLFDSNLFLVISDGISARVGSLSSNEERFQKWRTVNGENDLDPLGPNRELETLIKGLFKKEVILEFIQHFFVFEEDKIISKKIAAYHQFNAVIETIKKVVSASQIDGDRKGGVIWHTQGSGKSLEMIFLSSQLMGNGNLDNPTIIFLNDRKNLDSQLFKSFCLAKDLLPDLPIKAADIDDLRNLLQDRPSGGIFFSTIQKFALKEGEVSYPILSNRRNIIVICDEAHRTQYGFKAKFDTSTGNIKYGLAKKVRDAFPNATFVAFTGTPISFSDRDTRSVFGEYNSIYDIKQAQDDGATVPIYYESRQAKLAIKKELLPVVDSAVDEIFEDEDDLSVEEKVKTQWSRLESLIGTKSRLKQIANDFVLHFDKRSLVQEGKVMIVCMTREICAKLYDEIIKLRPDWNDQELEKGKMKIVMTSSASDKSFMQKHHTNKKDRELLERRFKDPSDELKIVIVRDMWLTGFDVPCLSTMYIDKPMKGANLAQGIARVNRVFKDKSGGLIVDYIGILPQLKDVLADYSSVNGKPTIDIEVAYQVLIKNYQIVCDILTPVDWSEYKNPEKIFIILAKCMDHILSIKDGRKTFSDAVLIMSRSFSICTNLDKASKLNEEISFFQGIRSLLQKDNLPIPGSKNDTKYNLQKVLSTVLVSDQVTDVLTLIGSEKPDISILSDGFLQEISNMPQKNLALDLLNRLLNNQVSSKFRSNLVQKRVFSELLQKSINKYSNRSIEAAEVIKELIQIANKFKEESLKLDSLNLTTPEIAFYDAISNNKSVKELMSETVLVNMAREIAEKIRNNLSIDWQHKENVRAKLRLIVKSLLKKYKYPPDQEKNTIELVIKQAELLSV